MSLARTAAALKVVPASSAKAGMESLTIDAPTAARMIDSTLLRPEVTVAQIIKLCEEAAQHRFWSVCVNPSYVPLAISKLRGSGVKVVTVVGFPYGATMTTVKRFEASEALRLGAAEIDMVLDIGALKSGDYDAVRSGIRGVADICRSAGGLLKVAIEATLLMQSEKTLACELAVAGGAQFVKTASGIHPAAVAVEDVLLMRRVVGDKIGVKAAGEISNAEQFRALVAAGATRIGTNAGADILKELQT